MINLDSLSDIGKVTSYLMSIGIDPMEYMSEIPNYYLYESDIDYIRIPSNIKRINSDAFNGCPRLSNVFIEDSVEFISDGAFSYCEQLKFITLPK